MTKPDTTFRWKPHFYPHFVFCKRGRHHLRHTIMTTFVTTISTMRVENTTIQTTDQLNKALENQTCLRSMVVCTSVREKPIFERTGSRPYDINLYSTWLGPKSLPPRLGSVTDSPQHPASPHVDKGLSKEQWKRKWDKELEETFGEIRLDKLRRRYNAIKLHKQRTVCHVRTKCFIPKYISRWYSIPLRNTMYIQYKEQKQFLIFRGCLLRL